MADFSKAIGAVLAHEGGYVDHPNDPGGATNYGISTKFLRGIGDMRNVADLTIADATALYRTHFWDALGLDALADQAIAGRVFDVGVNMGLGWAGRLLQRALRAAGDQTVTEDGALGPATLAAANAAPALVLLAALRAEQAGRYREIVAKFPGQGVFLKGWLSRAYAP